MKLLSTLALCFAAIAAPLMADNAEGQLLAYWHASSFSPGATTVYPTSLQHMQSATLSWHGVTPYPYAPQQSEQWFAAYGWPETVGIDTDRYLQITLTPDPGAVYSINSILMGFYVDDGGPTRYDLRYSVDGFANPLDNGDPVFSGETLIEFAPGPISPWFGVAAFAPMSTVPGLTNRTEAITFRLYASGATDSAAGFGFRAYPGSDEYSPFAIYGTAVPEPETYAAIAGGALVAFAAWRRAKC